MKHLYRFSWDCGRMGEVEGVFIGWEDEIKNAIGKHVYFGEILGKHSEITGTLNVKDFTIVSSDQEFLDKLESVFGKKTICGYNPLEYIEDEEGE